MAGFVWGAGGAQLTPEQIAAQQKVAQALMEKASDTSPVQHWTQGANRVLQGLLGGYESRVADEATKANADYNKTAVANILNGGAAGAAPAVTPAAAPTAAAAPAAVPVAGDPSLPRGIRNNNPLNIEAGSFTQGVPGYSGTDGRFAKFDSPQGGIMAANKLLDVYQNKYGLNTVNGIINRWAPVSDGNNVNAYAANVSKQLGIDPNVPIPPEMRPKLIAAMGQHENGRPIGPVNLTQADPAAIPPTAAPAQYVAPGTGQTITPAAPARPTINPAAVYGVLADPRSSEATKAVATLMLQHQMSQQGVTHVDAGNSIIVLDKQGNEVRRLPKGEPNKGPEFGVIGKDPFGNETYGWRDPRDKSVSPVAASGSSPGGQMPLTIPGPDGKPVTVPAGQDPKVYREVLSKASVANSQPANFDDVAKVRHEVTQLPSYKNISQAAPIYKAMVDTAGTNSKASDLNLVYGLGKIMDPTSVVREGEMIMVKNTASLPDWLVGAANGLNGGQALTPETREAILREAHNRVTSYKTMFDQDANMYRGIAKRNRMDEADVIPDFGEFKPWVRPAASPSAGAPAVATKPGAVRKFNPATGKIE